MSVSQEKSSNPFTEYYKTITNTELIVILDNPDKYQQEAVDAAKLEFNDRNLSEEQIAEARTSILASYTEQEQQKEKIKAIKDKVRNTGSLIAEAINPIQKSKPTTDKIILTISIIYGIMLLYTLISQYMTILIYFIYIFKFPSESLSLIVPILLLLLGIILFWKRKKAGWILLAFYATCLSVISFWEIIRAFSWEPSGIEFFDILNPALSPVILLATFIFYAGTIFTLCKTGIREVYSITRNNMFTTLGASSFLGVFILLLRFY